jgi:hypothetical protein
MALVFLSGQRDQGSPLSRLDPKCLRIMLELVLKEVRRFCPAVLIITGQARTLDLSNAVRRADVHDVVLAVNFSTRVHFEVRALHGFC